MTMTEETVRTDLSDLVKSRRAELRLGYRTLAAACIDPENPDAGPQWTRGTIENLEKARGTKPPTPPQLRGLAAGLKVPGHRVREAAGGQWFGIDTVWSTSGDARALVERADRLTPEAREQLVRFVDSLTTEADEN
jgi:hypothetical protein